MFISFLFQIRFRAAVSEELQHCGRFFTPRVHRGFTIRIHCIHIRTELQKSVRRFEHFRFFASNSVAWSEPMCSTAAISGVQFPIYDRRVGSQPSSTFVRTSARAEAIKNGSRAFFGIHAAAPFPFINRAFTSAPASPVLCELKAGVKDSPQASSQWTGGRTTPLVLRAVALIRRDDPTCRDHR